MNNYAAWQLVWKLVPTITEIYKQTFFLFVVFKIENLVEF